MKKQYSIIISTLFFFMIIISIGAATVTFISINMVITSGIIFGIIGFIVSRYGGEEFCVLLINAKKKDCLATAERIRSEIESYTYTDGSIKEKMTISIGMSECPEDAKDLEGFLKYADDKMYEAKKAGRNCIR